MSLPTTIPETAVFTPCLAVLSGAFLLLAKVARKRTVEFGAAAAKYKLQRWAEDGADGQRAEESARPRKNRISQWRIIHSPPDDDGGILAAKCAL